MTLPEEGYILMFYGIPHYYGVARDDLGECVYRQGALTHTHTQWNLMRLFLFSFVGTWELTFLFFSFDAGRDRRAITISAEKDRWIGIRK